MHSQQSANTFDHQIVALQSLLPQLDAEWDILTRSIQDDQQGLSTLLQRQEQLSLLLSPEREPDTHFMLGLIGYLDTVEQQVRQVSEEIVRKQLLRRALEQRFDEVRLVLCVLQQQGT